MLLFMIAASVSIDSFITGIVFGFKKVKFSISSFLVMVFLFFFYCFLAHGFAIGLLSLTQNHPFLNWTLRFLGRVSLFFIGLYFVFKEQKATQSSNQTLHILNDPISADTDQSGVIDLKESFFLTIALSIDTVIAVFSTVVTGFTNIYSSLLFALVQSLFLLIGLSSGKLLSEFIRTPKLNFSSLKRPLH